MKDKKIEHRDIRVSGIVQGVGFRPFVHAVAVRLGVRGTVRNDSLGVLIEAEGPAAALDELVRQVRENPPPMAVVETVRTAPGPVRGDDGFTIVASREEEGEITLVSPDTATCADCVRELFDPRDRRYRYPFINCTNCGPRYTIIAELPYDRPKTTMSAFTQCPACAAEYHDPADRRFHAQPNACPVCGPRCVLWDAEGNRIEQPDPVAGAVEALRRGRIVAVKGLGGFHLAVDAGDEEAVRRLRQRKRRDEKPFAVMARDVAAVRRFARLGEDEETLLLSRQRPIVLLEKEPAGAGALAPSVAPGNRFIGAMLPYTPLHHLLLSDDGLPALVLTSGNFCEEPIVTDNLAARQFLSSIADLFLTHDRGILVRNDDSVVCSFRSRIYFLRRSRGYAPVPVAAARPLPHALAVGGELKNVVAVSRDRRVFLSQHIGDLENAEVFSSFEETVEHLQRLFEVRPTVVAYDLHPDYLSTKYALSLGGEIRKTGVQHHHAHIASCLADNEAPGPVIGLSMDGTGYGPDGRIWGGEVLECDCRSFKRALHLRYVPLPGGGRAVREPWRMALSHLRDAFGAEAPRLGLPFLRGLDAGNVALVGSMMERRLNCPETSSLGRLFDAVAALSGLRTRSSYEGQAALELEMVAGPPDPASAYVFGLEEKVFDARPVIRRIAEEAGRDVGVETISARFHDGLVALFVSVCEYLREKRRLEAVALSGGVFQNVRLLAPLVDRLENRKFRVYTHRRVPCNDGGLALGQIAVACAGAWSPSD